MIRLHNPVFNYVLFVAHQCEFADAVSEFNRMFESDFEATQKIPLAKFLALRGELSHMIWLGPDWSPGVLAHEAFHSAAHVMRCVGMPKLTAKNEECATYLLQWTIDETLAKMPRVRKK
jgi:hypothetical protein